MFLHSILILAAITLVSCAEPTRRRGDSPLPAVAPSPTPTIPAATTTAQPEEEEFQGGATYVRWGKTKCPDDNELVYAGVVGGSHWNEQGGGSNYICLSNHVEYGEFTAALEGHAKIYGAEYKVLEKIFNHDNAEKFANQDAVCAICRSTKRTSQVMVPGRKTCPGKGWNIEYWGYLMTSHYNHKGQHNFICVDHAPEADPEGYRTDGGALLYHVQGVCGSLPCPNYSQGKEITCVVCTK